MKIKYLLALLPFSCFGMEDLEPKTEHQSLSDFVSNHLHSLPMIEIEVDSYTPETIELFLKFLNKSYLKREGSYHYFIALSCALIDGVIKAPSWTHEQKKEVLVKTFYNHAIGHFY